MRNADLEHLPAYLRLRNVYTTGDESGRTPPDNGEAFQGLRNLDDPDGTPTGYRGHESSS